MNTTTLTGTNQETLSVKFRKDETLISRKSSGGFEIISPTEKTAIYNYKSIAFLDGKLYLDEPLHQRTYLDGGPWNGEDDGGHSLFVYRGGDAIWTAREGFDGADLDCLLSEITINSKISGGYSLKTPSGTLDLWAPRKINNPLDSSMIPIMIC